MSPRDPTAARFGWAGFIAGPAAWALSTQVNYALVPWGCQQGVQPVPWVALALMLIALAGSLMSWRAWRELAPERHAARFIAAVSVPLSGLFALIIAVQGVAAIFLTGCEK